MIQFKNVNFSYSMSSQLVLEDINLNLEPGHIYGLLGKNGVGKTTLFRLITGLNRVSAGSVETLGAVPHNRLPSMLSQIFLLPEKIHAPNMSIVNYGKKYGSFYPDYSESKLESLLKGFEVRPDQPLSSMSQGQHKKAYMAFALACNTKILLMDEPTNGLDIPSKSIFRNCLAEQNTPDRLIIISTHQVRDLERLIDGVIILEDRSILMCDTADNLLNRFHFGNITDPGKVIYQEDTVQGKIGLQTRDTEPVQSIAELNLETLFNAVISDKKRTW